MHWLWLLIIGIVAGWLSGKLTRGRGFGLIGDPVVGIIFSGCDKHKVELMSSRKITADAVPQSVGTHYSVAFCMRRIRSTG